MSETEHDDNDPVIFGYAASCNISFRGKRESGYTWGEWNEMSGKEQDEARTEFLYSTLGVEVWEK